MERDTRSFDELPTRVTFVRHGESVANQTRGWCFRDKAEREAYRVACGSLADQDVPLSELGREQAKLVGQAIVAERPPTRVYCSPHRRTRETMSLAFPEWPDNRVIYDLRLRERESYPFNCMTQTEIDYHFPWQQRLFKEVGAFYTRNPGGESLADLADGRIRSFLEDLMWWVRLHPSGDHVVVFTHGNVMKVIWLLHGDHDPEELRDENALRIGNCATMSYDAVLRLSGV